MMPNVSFKYVSNVYKALTFIITLCVSLINIYMCACM